MAIYRQLGAGAEKGPDRSVAMLPDGNLAVMPVVYVAEFDVRLPGTIVTRTGEVIDVIDFQHVRVRWAPDMAEEVVHVTALTFDEYAALEKDIEHALCAQCNQRHIPNMRCVEGS